MKPRTKWILGIGAAAAYLLWQRQNQAAPPLVAPPAVTGTSLTSTNPYVIKVASGTLYTGLPTLGGKPAPQPPPPKTAI